MRKAFSISLSEELGQKVDKLVKENNYVSGSEFFVTLLEKE